MVLITDEVIDEDRELCLLELLSRVIVAGVPFVAVFLVVACVLVAVGVSFTDVSFVAVVAVVAVVSYAVAVLAVFIAVSAVFISVPAVFIAVSAVARWATLHNQEVSLLELFSRVVLLRRVYFPEWGSCVIPPQSRE